MTLRLVKDGEGPGLDEAIAHFSDLIRDALTAGEQVVVIVVPSAMDEDPTPHCSGDPLTGFAVGEEVCRKAKLQSLGLF